MTGVNATAHIGALFKEKGHILTCGYGRSGKGAAILLPALLHSSIQNDDAPSFVVLDPKGENIAVAGNYLKRSGYDVILIDPFNLPILRDWEHHRFNPFDIFDRDSPDFDDYIDLIRYAIIPPDPKKHANSYFSEMAGSILSLYMRHMMTQDDEPKNIRTLYRWLRAGGDDRKMLLANMCLNDAYDVNVDAESIVQQFQDGGKSIGDVYGNVLSATDIFQNESLRRNMDACDFDITKIAAKKTAIFLCLEPHQMEQKPAWMRMVIACFMRTLYRHYNPKRKVVMMMDEFYSMGYLKEFERGVGYLGQFVTLWPVFQDLNQLKTHYPTIWEGFVGNTAIRHWMVRDNFTAEYLSKRMPIDLLFMGTNPDGSPKYKEKPLMTAVEIMNCEDIIMEVDKMGKPALIPKKYYFTYLDNFDPNPFYH